MEYALEIKNLCKTYRSSSFAIKDVSFALPKGFIMGFVGKNGAGKTTTIKSILNMLNRDSGEVRMFGLDNIQNEAEAKGRIGIVMDTTFFMEEWTLLEIGKALKPFYPQWDDQKFRDLLKQFNLVETKKLKELSRGMKMKIMIACAMAHDPDLLILDEPTSGLDAVARDELMATLQGFINDENKAVLFSTHITSDLEKVADYITFIHDGRIMHSDTKDNLLEKYVVVKGGRDALNAEQRALVIGYTETKSNFSGITLKENLSSLPKAIVSEPCGLDDLVVAFNKGGAK